VGTGIAKTQLSVVNWHTSPSCEVAADRGGPGRGLSRWDSRQDFLIWGLVFVCYSAAVHTMQKI
jgi:hypothetical protein